MTRPHKVRPAQSEGIDRQILSQLRGRFLAVNQYRRARAIEGLAPRQQTLLSLLALLFHVNHPQLPGYVSACTPAGVSGYEPDASTLTAAQRLAGVFSYTRCCLPSPGRPIHGLFLMGSLGSLAQTDQNDMDVWICHAPDLDEPALVALREKCHRLEIWAASEGCEAHFFLMDAVRASKAQLRREDCAMTPYCLLLDEFYRTAIWLAGRTPLWWWVPEHEEARSAEFTDSLLSRHLIDPDEVIDFGHLAHIPAGDFLGAGLWQLLKGAESPYKSVLKLLLIEVYASEQPQVECLALGFKRAVYANQLDLDELDPYLMVYRRIEHYLKAQGDLQRLEIVRRSLYLKVNRKLTDATAPQGAQWQRRLLQRLTIEWGWDECQLALLDNRGQWTDEQVCRERMALARELNGSYRFLSLQACDEHVSGESAAHGAAPRNRALPL